MQVLVQQLAFSAIVLSASIMAWISLIQTLSSFSQKLLMKPNCGVKNFADLSSKILTKFMTIFIIGKECFQKLNVQFQMIFSPTKSRFFRFKTPRRKFNLKFFIFSILDPICSRQNLDRKHLEKLLFQRIPELKNDKKLSVNFLMNENFIFKVYMALIQRTEVEYIFMKW